MPDRPPGLIDLNRYEYELSYSGFQTFLKLPVALTTEDLRAGGVDVAIGGMPWDGTRAVVPAQASARVGSGLRTISGRLARKFHLGVGVDFFKHLTMADFGDAQVLHGAIELSFKNMKNFVAQIADGGAIPIIMGGDHAVSWPNVAALAEHHGYGRIGVVHFDAHADTAPLMPGQYASHGSHFRQLIDAGAINPKNFVQVGLRGYWPGPEILGWQAEVGIRTHFMAEILRYGFDRVLERASTRPWTAPTSCSSLSTSTSWTRLSRRAPVRRSQVV